MGQNRGTDTINYNQGRPAWNPTPAAKSLDKGDWFDVQGINFPVECEIQAVQFFHDQSKTQPVGSWDRTKGADPSLNGKFGISAQSATDVRITDEEDTAVDDSYWFSVVVQGPNEQSWSLDPQVINKRTK